ncbi:MAG: transport protein A [Burkholderiales bacterium PBB5]|nr:MAG: transport protein A [Burkholderiales bacterium PBB5]
MPTLLADLPDGALATVHALTHCAGKMLDAMHLRRLGELGFLPGEPVKVVRRGPGGREPLAVQVGDTMFALRLAEARCVQVKRAA